MRGKTFTLLVLAVLMTTSFLYGQTARVQIIHNSADAAAQQVDVYLDGSLLLDDFAFRSATSFIDAPADAAVDVGIAPQNSTSVDDTLYNATVTFTSGETYVVVANGIISGSGYSPAVPFDLYVYAMGQEEAQVAGETDVLVFHGSTDAPTVDVAEPELALGLLDDLAYGAFSPGYLNLATDDYSLQVQNAEGTAAVAQFGAPLASLGLEDSALVVVASGFLDPTVNSDGPAFGLFAALPEGGALVELPAEELSTSYVQVIHNAADLGAQTVDVWQNDQLLIDDFAFRTASPFVELTAGIEFDIVVQPPGSTDTTGALFRKSFTLAGNSDYILVANGIVSGSGYSPSQPFDIYAYAGAKMEAEMPGNTDILGFHGSTDAPDVDVVEPNLLLQYTNNFAYGTFTDGYTGFQTMDYSLQVQDSTGRSAVAQFRSALESLGLEDSAMVILASGFLDPSVNSDGPAFGLYAALPSGGALVELPQEEVSTSQVQIIHNSPDAAADTVDVWLNDQLLIDDFAFRNATPFTELTAGVLFDVSVQLPNSTDTVGAVYKETGMVAAGQKYVVIASGLVSTSGYDPHRDFGFDVFEMGRDTAMEAGEIDVLVYHGATDAPPVDGVEPGALLSLANNLSYGQFIDNYLELPVGDYSIQLQDSTGRSVVAQYGAPLETLGLQDTALVVLASGFLNPANNQDGPAFGLYAALPAGGELVALPAENTSTAGVQVIHNAPETAADTVDVWINDQLAFDDFAFRNATPFVDLPAGPLFDISVQPKNSTDTINALYKETAILAGNRKYVVIAGGLIDPTGYEPGREFGSFIYEMARDTAMESGNTDVLVFHGSPDAPPVDVKEPDLLQVLVDNLEYGTFSQGYLSLATNDYSLQIQDTTGRSAVAQFGAPLQTLGLQDSALVVVASGFLSPPTQQEAPGFGLYAALPSGGELVALPSEDLATARVQVIHNSADMAADTVDVWLNDEPLIDNFAFRNASSFVELTAGVDLDITVQPKNSTDTTNGLFRKTYSLPSDGQFVLIASGIVSGSGYDPLQPFDIYAYDMARDTSLAAGETDVMVFHGSTDAPTVDVMEPSAQLQLVDNLSYGQFIDEYLNLSAADYSLQVQNEYGSEAVAQFGAPLATLELEDTALVLVASGFLDPTVNSDGPAFGLYVALPSGGELVQLPSEDLSQALVQVIHNAPDAAASIVDIYKNDQLLLDDFEFRTASPFVSLTAGTMLDIVVQPSGSSDTTGALARFTYQLAPDENYVLTASGLVSTSGYDPIQPFDIKVFAGARTEASQSGNSDLLVFHGSTDAPSVDVYESSVPAGTLVDNLAYGTYAGDYLELATENYVIDIQDESGSTTVESFEANLSDLGLEDSAMVVVASGFLDPSVNSDGPAFGLYVALASGGDLVALPVAEPTGFEGELDESVRFQVYPNPTADVLSIEIRNESATPVFVELFNVVGQKLPTAFDQLPITGQRTLRYDVSNLPNGLYFVVLRNGDQRVTRKIKVTR